MTKSEYQVKYYINLDEWDAFVDLSPQGSLFCRSWWLNVVCPDSFQILTVTKGERIIAGMPLPISRKWREHSFLMPLLTQTLGVLIRPSEKLTYEGKLTEEMEGLKVLVEAIPRCDSFSMNFHYNFTNWLPFYWKGYQQTTYYTYIIKDLTDINMIYAKMTLSKRKRIEKAKKIVVVSADLSAKEFYENHKMTLAKQGKKIDYSYNMFKRIYTASNKNSAAKIWCASDEKNNIHAAIFIVYDAKSAYYLISSIDPDFRSSGATSLLHMEAIKYLSQYTKRYDFEGSMIPGVEHSFRKFGAVQVPYFRIYKDNRSLLKKISGRALRMVTR
jgi:lipid II:glycine glycyltransferase (peptidoglycan interpeptide bridge formation enzyme)